MATYETAVITSTRYEWRVPTSEPWGAAAEEIGKAWGAAETAYREINGIPKDTALPGNAISFHAHDDYIVLAFTHDTPKAAA